MSGKKRKDETEKVNDEMVDTQEEMPEDVDSKEELNALQQENEELLDRLKRKQADIDNLRRISKMEQAEAREYALYEFLCRLLPVLDNLERGLDSARADENIPSSYVEGLEMIRKQLIQILEQEGVSAIEAQGMPFDPHCHHAVIQVEAEDSEPGTVIEELQKGYKHRKRILRPAMVKVCRE
jgi:molecular chaperone GrpE